MSAEPSEATNSLSNEDVATLANGGVAQESELTEIKSGSNEEQVISAAAEASNVADDVKAAEEGEKVEMVQADIPTVDPAASKAEIVDPKTEDSELAAATAALTLEVDPTVEVQQEVQAVPVEALEGGVPGTESTSSLQSSTPAIQKKFTSLNVNRRFLEKASPILPTASVPVINKVTSTQPSSRLSSITPASRLTSAKLSTSIKPQPAGWGQVASSLSPSIASPTGDPLPSFSSTSTGITASGKPGLTASGVPTIASPKLVTALTSGSVNRSTSPQNKGSPGLRNAALSSSGRTASPSVSTPPVSTSTKVPWAKVKADAAHSNLSSDFPTAAEAARAKQEAERKEKAAAAEAAAKAEQALQHLERFRGASLGVGNHWDEMDDEDDLDEVVQFGDGTQYKVPVEPKEEPVSKEERFKDVGHDRSWPPKAGQARPPPVARSSSIRDPPLPSPVSTDGPTPRLFNSRSNNKVEIRSGEGISLETEPLDRGYQQREGRSFYRSRERDGDGPGYHATSTHAPPTVAAAPARAWGPLAQRQASLNPDAPKPSILSPPSSARAASALSPPTQPQVPERTQEKASVPVPSPTPASIISPKLSNNERALPPHLAQSHAALQRSVPSIISRTDLNPVEARSESAATPYGARFAGESAAAAAPHSANVVEDRAVSAVSQREEMLSAAERARKRRQEEEDKRLAEKERAKAKAAAIEEKMRLAKEEEERKKKEEMMKREEEVRQQKAKAEEARQREIERSTKERAELNRLQITDATTDRAGQRIVVPSILSPSDEAVTWRRGKPTTAITPVAPMGLHGDAERVTLLQRATPGQATKTNNAGQSRSSRVASNNEHDLASSTGMEGWDIVINRIKDSIPASAHAAEDKVPTGPRAASKATSADQRSIPQVKLPSRAAKVEIIAPNDEGAARQRVVESKQREARQTHGPSASPISVLKTANKLPMAPPESVVTRSEVDFDASPVWNRYKIKIGSLVPSPRLPHHLAKAQAIRMANSKTESHVPRPPNLLTWEPPIPNLSTRTLSRDDLFFPKKYLKGTVITKVTIPTAKFQRKPRAAVQQREMPVVRVPTSSGNEVQRKATSPKIQVNDAPRAPASMRTRESDSNSAVAFAHSIGARDNTPSPVSFMVTSELKVEEPNVSLPLSSPVLPRSSSVLPSPNPMASTWGQSSLTFAGLDASDPNKVTADRDHIREVWALPSNESASMQNSLRGIVDEFPDVPAQYHEVGINTGEAHHSAPNSRVYSPLTVNDKRADTSNGFTSITRASSPSTTKSSPQTRMSSNDFPSSVAKSDNHRSTVTASTFQSDSQRSASNAFTAYAYPSPLQEFSSAPSDTNFFNGGGQQQRGYGPHQQRAYGHHLDTNYGGTEKGGGGGGGYGQYRGSMNSAAARSDGNVSMMGDGNSWTMENPQAANTPYGMSRHHQQQQQHPGSYMMPATHQRTSSSGNMRNPSYNNNNSRGGAGGTMRPYRANDHTVW